MVSAHKNGSTTDAVKRKNTSNKDTEAKCDTSETDSENQNKHMTFDITSLKSVKTDFFKDGGFQKCVQISPDRSIIATGGGDGHLRVWKV